MRRGAEFRFRWTAGEKRRSEARSSHSQPTAGARRQFSARGGGFGGNGVEGLKENGDRALVPHTDYAGRFRSGLPAYAVLDLFVDIEHDRFWWWHGAALTASLLVALAALFVFLAALGFVQPLPAVLIALAFGLGSCAWPVSSQALWQHPAA